MTWMIVDGNNWFARDWYATQGAHAGEIAGQFLQRLQVIESQFKMTRVVVAWDHPRSFRKELVPTYKGNRTGKPDEYYTALASVTIAVTSARDSIQCDGFEADDIIASIVSIARSLGERCVIFSSDKDLHQLLCKQEVTQATSFTKQSSQAYGLKFTSADLLLEEYGVRPTQWVDYRVITGDTSDGIKGIVGIGPKAAREIMAKCGGLDQFYKSPFSVNLSATKREIMLRSRGEVPLLRQLLTLRTDAPLPEAWLSSLHAVGAT